MSNGTSAFERFSKLCFQVGKLVMDKKRDAGKVADVLQVILDNPEFAKALPPSNLIPADGWAAEWRRFYNEVFSLEVDLADVEISPEQPGFGWVVMVAQNLTLNQVWIKCKERFRTYSYVGDDLDATQDRTSSGAYAKRFRNRVQADEENRNFSANTLAEQEASSITLLERLLLELWYHWRTGEHLDDENVTLCAGSRDSGGYVPAVYCYFSKLYVSYSRPDSAYDEFRNRTAV